MHTTSINRSSSYTWLLDFTLIVITLSCLYFVLLGTRPLFTPDEGRYAEIAREMVTKQDYITPYLNNIKYFEKPILFYWLEAAAIKIFGLNVWALRSINALLSILCCLATYTISRQFYGRAAGLLAAFILATSLLYFVMGHMISLDMPITVFLTFCLYCFIASVSLAIPESKKRNLLYVGSISAALAVLSKGLIGLVFPGLIILTWLTFTRQLQLIRRMYIPTCLALFLIIAVPWHVIVHLKNPEFFYFYFINQHFLRYTLKGVGHYQPAWFFIPIVIFGFFPWCVLLPQMLWKMLTKLVNNFLAHRTELFFLIWIGIIFIFFSFSNSKLIPYILPIFPPLAILTARYIQLSFENKTYLGLKVGFLVLALVAITIFFGIHFFLNTTPVSYPLLATCYLYATATIFTLTLLFTAVFFKRLGQKVIIIFITGSACFLLLFIASIPSVETRSILPLAKHLKPRLKAGDEVITYNQYFQDLPFYLNRTVSILNWRNELSYGMQFQDTSAWMLTDKTFWTHWISNKNVYVIIDKNEYQKFLQTYPHTQSYVLVSTVNNLLISNRK